MAQKDVTIQGNSWQKVANIDSGVQNIGKYVVLIKPGNSVTAPTDKQGSFRLTEFSAVTSDQISSYFSVTTETHIWAYCEEVGRLGVTNG